MLCFSMDLLLLLCQRNVQRLIRIGLLSTCTLQSLLHHLHACRQAIAIAAFMRLPTHTAAQLLQAALNHVPQLLVPLAVCTAELLLLLLRHAAESCELSQTMCHLCLELEHVDLRHLVEKRLWLVLIGTSGIRQKI